MATYRLVPAGTLAVLLAALLATPAPASAQGPGTGATPGAAGTWSPPRTPWGHPDLSGIYTNKDENGIPMEKPDDLDAASPVITDQVRFAEILRERQERAAARAPSIGGTSDEDTGAGPPHWYENYEANNSRLWLVVDPPDGKIPPQTDEARQRAAARQQARRGRGPADSWEDRSLYDRCISLSLPGSMTPKIYGNSYEIVQSPTHVAIRYEMIHEARVIPLDGRPHVDPSIRQYMGDARARWEGDTLVVETTNFTDKVNIRGASEDLRLIERFTPIGPDAVEWSVTFNDSRTWTRPWTFAMNLTRDSSQAIFEYACHEGNLGLRNILSAARAEEAEERGAPGSAGAR